MDSTGGKREKIYVALSGGVDSSVSAALLKRAGHDVVGVFIKVWQPDFLPCTWKDDRQDAMRVCAHLGIPFLTLDLEDEYRRDVIDASTAAYIGGDTPNPDVLCNRHIKFGAFLAWARAQGASAIATGHYAVIRKNRRYSLWTSDDARKDQTYFLWMLSEKDLRYIRFPVGKMTKEDTRRTAKAFNLPTAQKKDSQGLCFVGKLDMKDFLGHFIETEPGRVLLNTGEIIGTHRGAELYTLGERHNFRITAPGNRRPLYVIEKSLERNTLVVAPKAEISVNAPRCIEIHSVNWIDEQGQEEKEYLARSRYREELFPVTLAFEGVCGRVIFQKPRPPIPSGQSLVLYERVRGESRLRCAGGGVVRPSSAILKSYGPRAPQYQKAGRNARAV